MVSNKHFPILAAAGLVLGMTFAFPASAKITCCDVDGKRTCGDPPPRQCLDKAKTVFKGGVAKDVEAPLTPEQRAVRDAEEAKKKEEERQAAEQARRDRALLDSYTSEAEIEKARERAVADIEKNAEQAKNRLVAAEKRKKKLEQEKEFYANKPIPAGLASQIKDNESEMAAQQKAMKQKDDDIAALNARFESDKLRYRQLSRKR